jgi:predicted metallopeptidase
MNATGSAEAIPREVERTTEINGRTVYLTNEQMSAYQYYVGNYTMSMYNWRMNSPKYVALPDEQKLKILVQDLTDVHSATKSALFGHDIRRLTRRQRVMRANLVNSPLGQSMPPR